MKDNQPFRVEVPDKYQLKNKHIGFHYVLYLDILGVKNKTITELDEIIRFLYSKTLAHIDAKMKLYESGYCKVSIKKILIFQDSVFIVFDNQQGDNLIDILEFTMTHFAMCFVNRVPIRGGLAYGEIVMYENSIFGEPISILIDSEKRINMLGIIVEPSIKKRYHETKEEKYGLSVITSNGKDDYINWLHGLYLHLSADTDLNYNSISEYFEYYISQFEVTDDPNIQKKYENTKLFFENELSTNPWINKGFLFSQNKFKTL